MIVRHLKKSIFVIFLIIVLVFSSKYSAISDVVDIAPGTVLQVTYGNVNVDYGNELMSTEVTDPPSVQWSASPDEYYTLCLIDPDAPNRQNPAARHWLHWLVGNIPGNQVSKGESLVEYAGATPPVGTGFHRYIFLLFKQPSKIEFREPFIGKSSGKGRNNFSYAKFAQIYKILQPAISGNFFVTQRVK